MSDEARAELAEESGQPTDSPDFYIVGIGASAGGLEALEQFFGHVPAETGMAFVVVQHLSPDFKSLMDELLARHTAIPIHRVEDTTEVEPNAIYLIPPKKNMTLSYGKLLLTEQDTSGGLNLPIDLFFRSLAQDAGKRAIAVVLSGTGSDGSRGVQDVHEAGGLVVVQDIESASFDGMPRNAIGTGLADVVTSAAEMGAEITRYAADPRGFPRGDRDIDDVMLPGSELTVIFRLFRNRFGIDFTLYRANTIHRRIDRRMKIVRCHELSDYVATLEDDIGELDALYRDLLVEVTHFFRDPRAFERIRKDVIPGIMAQASGPRDEVRVWVPGCATGEEAYSLAMLLDDFALQHRSSATIKVFATDVHRNSLETAGSGVYAAESLTNVPEELRDRYFARHGNFYHVSRDLRQMVIFAPHDITKDPPFTKIDLLSCRNVLIYLDPAVQKRALSLFHFGLRVGGVMMLGPSESVGDLNREFDTVDQHWRVFRKLRDVRLPEAKSMPLSPALTSVVRAKPPFAGTARLENGLESSVLDDLLDRYVPPSFLVNVHYELVHSFGDARKYLIQPKGPPTLEVLKMVDGDLRMALSAALHRATREQDRVVMQGIRVKTDDGRHPMQIIVEPYTKRNQNLLLVCLEELKEPYPAPEPTAQVFDASDQATQRIVDLERELEVTKESLQTTVEELESSNEELQSTNEELVASNEELQSTNEELHSVNEELYTVNAEHQHKIEELTQLTNDMDNLLRSTEIGTIFLDRELRIRKFTPAIAAAFNILEQDIGRPIDQFAYNLDNTELLDDARRVLSTGEPLERKVSSRESVAYLLQIQPYRTNSGRIDGVVITFTDISYVVEAETERKQREHLERVTKDLQEFAYAVSHDLSAPLRQIVQHGETLMADEELSSQGTQALEFVTSGAGRLERMLDGLLQYSRVNTRGKQFAPIHCGDVLGVVLERLRPAIDAANAEVTCDDLPIVVADREQLYTVFYNLLDNALKFRGDEPLKININSRQVDGFWEISVRDNGIGIAPANADGIFVIFKRLHHPSEFPGMGVGLPICKRIVERHEGQITVDSDVGRGSVFTFTLPTDQPDRRPVSASMA